jgi:hypothetical protein
MICLFSADCLTDLLLKTDIMFAQISFLVGLSAVGEIRTQFAAEVGFGLVLGFIYKLSAIHAVVVCVCGGLFYNSLLDKVSRQAVECKNLMKDSCSIRNAVFAPYC